MSNSRIRKSMRLVTAILAIVFLLANNSFCQVSIKPIPTNHNLPKDSIVIKVNRFDSTSEYIHGFIMNTTDTLLHVEGFYHKVSFDWQVRDSFGKWRNLRKYRGPICGTGYNQFDVPPNHYTGEVIRRTKYVGSFKTEARLSYPLYSDTIHSLPFSYSVDTIYYLTPINQALQRINYELQSPYVSNDKKDELKIRKVLICIAENRLIEAEQTLNELSDRETDIRYDVNYHSAALLALELSKVNSELPREESCRRVRDIIKLYRSIPNNHQKADSARTRAKNYEKYADANCPKESSDNY